MKISQAFQRYVKTMVNLQATLISLQAICFILNLPPSIWHIMNKNIPALTLLIYVEILMMDGFVSAIVWGGPDYVNAWNGKVWCDIMVRIQLAASVGISSSISCVSFNLLMIFLTNRMTTFWFGNKWVKPCCEVFFSIVFPFIISGVAYLAQSFRYLISRYSGCSPPLVTDSISVVTFYLWIFVWNFISMAISLATLILFFKKRRAAKDILVCTNSGLSVKRFIRLLTYCILVVCSSIVFSAVLGSILVIKKGVFYEKEIAQRRKWGTYIVASRNSESDINTWVLITISFVSFFLFGVGEDAAKMYCTIVSKLPYGDWLLKKLGRICGGLRGVFGGDIMTDENKFMLRFWRAGDSDDDDDSKKDLAMAFGSDSCGGSSYNSSSDAEARSCLADGVYCYSPGTGVSDEFSLEKYEGLVTEREHELSTLGTPATATTNETFMRACDDENLRFQLQQAQREVDAEAAAAFDELRYLYY